MNSQATLTGLAKAREIFQNRDEKIRSIQSQGTQIIGYLCAFVPIEIITALDMVPYRILGCPKEAVTVGDSHLQTIICPFIRNCFDQSLKGKYDFLDGFVTVHTCDTVQSVAQFWNYYVQFPYDHYIDMPHTTHHNSFEFFKNEIHLFKKTLEEFAGKKISNQKLEEAIQLHNDQRSLARELYELKQYDPPLLTGSETFQILMAVMTLPAEEGNTLLREAIHEIRNREETPQKQSIRLFLWGSPLDDLDIIEMIEDCGANIVIDDTCLGTRFFWSDVQLSSDSIASLAKRYLDDVPCPRTFRDEGADYWGNLDYRYGYVKEMVLKWNVNAALLQSMKYCDTHGYEVPAISDYLKSLGIPTHYLEHEYIMVSIPPLKTRVQAFFESLD